jgi:hypothetical protein
MKAVQQVKNIYKINDITDFNEKAFILFIKGGVRESFVCS